MPRAYLLSPRWSDIATLSGSATVGNGVIGNVQNNNPQLRAVFTGSSVYIEGDFGVSRTIDSLGLGFLNSISGADTIQFRCKNTYPVTSSPLYDSTPVTVWNSGSDLSSYLEIHKSLEWDSVTARYFRVDISCSHNVQLGRLMVGRRVEPVNDISFITPGGPEAQSIVTSLSGSDFTRFQGGIKRSVKVEWLGLTKTESFKNIKEFLLERGANRDFMLSCDSADIIAPMAYIYIGRSPAGLNLPHNGFLHIWTANLEVFEMGPIRMAT